MSRRFPLKTKNNLRITVLQLSRKISFTKTSIPFPTLSSFYPARIADRIITLYPEQIQFPQTNKQTNKHTPCLLSESRHTQRSNRVLSIRPKERTGREISFLGRVLLSLLPARIRISFRTRHVQGRIMKIQRRRAEPSRIIAAESSSAELFPPQFTGRRLVPRSLSAFSTDPPLSFPSLPFVWCGNSTRQLFMFPYILFMLLNTAYIILQRWRNLPFKLRKIFRMRYH